MTVTKSKKNNEDTSGNLVTIDDVVEKRTEIMETKSGIVKVTENSAELKVKQESKKNKANRLDNMKSLVVLISCLFLLKGL